MNNHTNKNNTHLDPEDLSPVTPSDEYHANFTRRKKAGGNIIKAETEKHGPVAGKYVREMIEAKAYRRDAPIFLGYDDTARAGFREIGFTFDSFKRHMWVSGTTGAGKTTVLHNKALHHAFGNHGFCNIDPKADGDTLELLQKIPNARLDDVIFIEPGSSEFDRTIGINILDVPAIYDDDEREKEIENRLENLTAIFDNDDYWGPTMASITESMGRAMLRHNAEISLDDSRNPNEKYSVIDMYFTLLKQQRREEFAAQVDDPYLRDFLDEIADMSDEDVRPLLKRIKRWVENPIVRRIIAQRESTIDWDEIVDEEKILLVRIPVDSQDVHQMITLTVLRNIWSAKKRQVRDENRPEDQPYFVQVDEFEKVANDNLNMDGMLARARSFWLSVALGTQYPNQIKVDHERILRAMENNCNTLLAMKTPGSKDSRILMERFNEYNSTDLINTDKHRMWTKIPLPDGTESEPVNIKTFAPYPPLRNEAAAKAAIYESLLKFGTDPISEQEIQEGIKIGDIGELTAAEDSGYDELADAGTKDGAELTFEMLPDRLFLESVFAAQIRHEGVDEPVPKPDVIEALNNRVGEVDFESQISNFFEKHEDIRVSDKRINGEISVKLTEPGVNKVLSHDTGSSSTGGHDAHRWVLKQSYKLFTKLGAVTRLPSQDEADELPDGVADLPFHPMEDADTLEEANELRDKLESEYGRLYEIGNGKDISIEAETSTINKPTRTLRNLRKAVDKDKRCVFTCKDGYNSDRVPDDITGWPSRGQQLIFGTDENGNIDYDTINCVSKVYPNGDRKFYNKTQKHKIDSGRTVVAKKHPAHGQIKWREKDNKIVAISKRNGEYKDAVLHEFANPQQAVNPPVATTLHREKISGNWVVKEGKGEDSTVYDRFDDLDDLREEYMDMYPPVIPEIVFPREIESVDFCFIVFPDEDNPNFESGNPVLIDEDTVEPVFSDSGDVEIENDDYELEEGGGEADNSGEAGGNEDGSPAAEQPSESASKASAEGRQSAESSAESTNQQHPQPVNTDGGVAVESGQSGGQPGQQAAAAANGQGNTSEQQIPECYAEDCTARSWDTDDIFGDLMCAECGCNPPESYREQVRIDHPDYNPRLEVEKEAGKAGKANDTTEDEPQQPASTDTSPDHDATSEVTPQSEATDTGPSTNGSTAGQSTSESPADPDPEPASPADSPPSSATDSPQSQGEPTGDLSETEPDQFFTEAESDAESDPEIVGLTDPEPAQNGQSTTNTQSEPQAESTSEPASSTPQQASTEQSTPDPSATVEVPDDPGESNDSEGDSVECPYGVAPHEITGMFNDKFDKERLNTFATGFDVPAGKEFQQLIEAIQQVDPEAAEWIDGPADIKHVLGSNAGS